ncbi:MAG: hypothetical protein FJ276_12300 [Planctomycetes bacterium]|nr:hypothetical protein [Planctomycetota bacterium]
MADHRRAKPDVGELLNRFAAEEKAFLQRSFLAPALRGGRVGVRLGGVTCTMRVEPSDFEGWGVFQPLSASEAILERRATLAERRAYLELFPMIRLLVCLRSNRGWYGSAASFGDARFRVAGLAPIQLAQEVQLFDCARTRFDGAHFWFDELDVGHDMAAARYLRAALGDRLRPHLLERPGLVAEQRAAYEVSYWELVRPSSPPGRRGTGWPRRGRGGKPRAAEPPTASDDAYRLLRDNLSHAGAELVDFLEREDGFRVTFRIGGRQFTSAVDKGDLTVQVAGICLSGEDRKFDLNSLVGVLRESGHGGGVVQVGDGGMAEDENWRVHPPRDP